MAIPSGAGTEVLKASYMNGLTSSAITLIAGDAVKIRTVLSVVISEQAGVAETFGLWVDAGYNDANGASGTDIYLCNSMPVGANETFIFSDKIVIYGLDALKVYCNGGGNLDVHCSYIEQDWT
jgi:hypothetical protein